MRFLHDVVAARADLARRVAGSKIAHFKELHKKTGIPYEEMVSLHTRSLATKLTTSSPTRSCSSMVSAVWRC